MARYTALTPITHDGKRYAVGASIDLTKAEADALPHGAVDQPHADDSAARKAADKARKAEAERLAAEQAEAERKAQEEAEAAKKAEAERRQAEKAEMERKAAEQKAADAAQGNGSTQG
ncbi:MAG: hypothetical protein LWW96_14325 [Acidovorax sp.]|uniref:DUF7210 family protein n=1 Tax=Acidovorax sp. TaxID=1872122 RepID=UPI0025C45BB1|nr:hypothetical protein [Acidovorax sp.]MCE1193319.1 hypothetical protein [Acidovorax sp.]